LDFASRCQRRPIISRKRLRPRPTT
jgi:hypothetical protein